MNETITLTTKANAEDYQALVWFNLVQKRKYLLWFLGFSAVLALGAIIGRVTGFFTISDFYFYICLAYWGLLILEVFVIKLSIRRFVASDKAVIGQERQVVIDQSGVTSSGDDRSYAVYHWEQIFKAFESKKYFFLFLNTAMAIILPKAHFRQEDVPMLEELLKEKLGSKFRRKG